MEVENEVLDQAFQEQALAVMEDIGLPEDEAEMLLEDYMFMFEM